MDQHLEEDTIFTFPTRLHQEPAHTQTLDTPTARHLATAIHPRSHDHSWRVVITASDLTKSKSSMKLPEEIVQLAVLALHPLFSKIKPLQIYKSNYNIASRAAQSNSVYVSVLLGQLLRFLRAFQTSRVLHNSIVHAKA